MTSVKTTYRAITLFIAGLLVAASVAAEPEIDAAKGPVEPVGFQTFEPGDVFVSATYLNDPNDDHRGRGRILQYDANLNLKGVFWTEGTTHLVSGLSFGPDSTLWVFDIWAWQAVRISADGKQLPNHQYAQRPLATVHFMDDGSLIFPEAMAGDSQPMTLSTRHPVLPGETSKFGDGDIYHFDAEGQLLEVFDPEFHGGVTGSFAINHSVLAADHQSLIYVSETGNRVMHYDLVKGVQLPDIPRDTSQQPQMHFALAAMSDERLLISMANRLDLISESGDQLRTYPLEGFGWSVIGVSPDERYAYVGNWFNGELAKLDLNDGEFKATTKVCERCMAGLTVYNGKPDLEAKGTTAER